MAEPTPTGPSAVLSQLKQLWSKQSRGVRMLAILVVVGVLGFVVVTNVLSKVEGFTPMAEGASPDDASELLSALQARGVNARLRDGKVEVANGDLENARAVAAAAGLPRGGKGFEIFDGSNLGQSSFAEQVNYRRALQGELQRSIAALAQVQGARVHIALGHHSVFKDQSERPTASVALHLHPGQTLSAEQVRGVRQLVAASIEGLSADAVVIVDNHGNLLDASAPGVGDQRAEIEHSVATRVRTMLERVVGPGKVSVVATAAVDERKVSETQEVYDNEHPVIRSETRSIDGVDANQINSLTSGVAGTRGNLPGAAAGTNAPGTTTGRMNETKNYEISRTVRQTTKPDVSLQKLQVAVVVDYKVDDKGKPVARTDKELAELTALARQAAGIDDARGDKIEMRSIPFVADPESVEPAPLPPPAPLIPTLYLYAGAGGLAFIVIVVALLMRRRASKKRQAPRHMSLALPAPVAELERALEAKPLNDLPTPLEAAARPGLPPAQPIRERVLDVVRNDIERAAEVLTSWLSEVPPIKGAKS